MKQYILKLSAWTAILLMLYSGGFSQDKDSTMVEKKEKIGGNDEIIIKRKGDKDSKIVVEMKDGQVLINGKSVEEFTDENISVEKFNDWGEGAVVAIPPIPPRSPFRGGSWSYQLRDDMEMDAQSNVAFLGVSSENAKTGGAQIEEVTKGSAAEKIGLKRGDIITKINETKVGGPEELTEAIHKYKPEDKVVVTYTRLGKEQKSTAVLGRLRGMNTNVYNLRMPRIAPDMNMNFSYYYNTDSRRLGIKAQDTEDGKGVKVLDVEGESPAEKAGIKEGDIITQFDGKPVNSATQLADLARETKTKDSFKIKINRAGKQQELEVKIPKKLKTANL
jgi:serine protease Do